MWQEVHGRYDRHSSGPLTAGWERGNCRQAFSYMFEGFSGTRYSSGASSAIQRPEWLRNFFIPFCVFMFSFYPVFIVPFSFERIFTFTFPFALTVSLFFVNKYFCFHFRQRKSHWLPSHKFTAYCVTKATHTHIDSSHRVRLLCVSCAVPCAEISSGRCMNCPGYLQINSWQYTAVQSKDKSHFILSGMVESPWWSNKRLIYHSLSVNWYMNILHMMRYDRDKHLIFNKVR